MKLATVVSNGEILYGVLDGNTFVAAGEALRAVCPTLADCIALDRLGELGQGRRIAAGDFTWLPPIPNPSKVLCIGINYRNHADETGRDLPPQPSVFLKHPHALVGHGDAMIRPAASRNFDFEGELALVIGRGGRNIAEADAMSHVLGWSCFNDGSLRDYQKHSVTAGKNFHRSGSFGPWIVTADAAPSLDEMVLETRLNGETVQHSPVDRLIYGVPRVVAYVSTFMPLLPGDVIATGTPAGVGARRNPPLWMKPGDCIAVEITGIGTLENGIEDEQPA